MPWQLQGDHCISVDRGVRPLNRPNSLGRQTRGNKEEGEKETLLVKSNDKWNGVSIDGRRV